MIHPALRGSVFKLRADKAAERTKVRLPPLDGQFKERPFFIMLNCMCGFDTGMGTLDFGKTRIDQPSYGTVPGQYGILFSNILLRHTKDD